MFRHFSRGKRKFIITFFVLVVIIILIFNKQSKNSLFTPLNIISPVLKISFFTTNKLTGFMADIKNYFNLKQENDSLREENNVLLNENRSLREFASESLRLKEMLGFSHRSDFKLYPASVIGRDATNFFNTLIIDKGLNDGIRQDMVVVNNIGIIGRVVSVSNNNAKVILLSDSNCSISAIDSRSRVYGLVAGVGGTNCVMKYVSVDDDVKVGDTVISSGDGEIFPKGFLIGRVCKVEKSRDELMLDIYVRPVVKFSTLEEVFVVLK